MHRLSSFEGAPASTLSRRRLLALGAGAGLAFVGLSARLYQLQIVEGERHLAKAEQNRNYLVHLPGARGLILDRNRLPLVRNRPAYTVSVLPADLPARPDEVYRKLSKLVGGSPQEFGRSVERGRDPFSAIPLRTLGDPRVAHAVEARLPELPGIHVGAGATRQYVDGPVTSHLLGHVGPISEEQLGKLPGYHRLDLIGQAGLESTLEEHLRGRPGKRQSEIDATGREVRPLAVEPPRPGNNVVLTIDLALQREIHRILMSRVAEFEVASAVVVDPRNGEVLGVGHVPAYSNDVIASGASDDDLGRMLKDPARPMLNGAVSSAWPPGSIFKIVTALAALNAGVVKPETKIHCGGGIRLAGGTFLGCWAPHGQQDLFSALANSCDTYFYQLVGGEPLGRWQGIGPDRLAEWARHFGMGTPTGVDLPAEAPGLVPTPAWKKEAHREPWFHGDSYISAIGQGFYLATPIQMAMMAAATANGGTLYRPRLVREVFDARGAIVERGEPEVIGKIPSDPAHMALVREGVRAGMLIGTSPYGSNYYGTSWTSNIKEIAIAGKTGTSEWGVKGPDGKMPTHGWFAFWAPHESPKIAGAVFVKRGRGAQEAGVVAAQIIKAYFGIV